LCHKKELLHNAFARMPAVAVVGITDNNAKNLELKGEIVHSYRIFLLQKDADGVTPSLDKESLTADQKSKIIITPLKRACISSPCSRTRSSSF
jgi:hypothetical protein